MKILDIGCAEGAQLSVLEGERHGLDIDAHAIRRGRVLHPDLKLVVGRAEALPYPAGYFDRVVSNVALPYTDISASLAEIHRVLRPGGDAILKMHDWRMHTKWALSALRSFTVKRSIDFLFYGYPASVIHILTGYTPARPWKGTRETFQTVGSMRRSLERVGLTLRDSTRTSRDFIVMAARPATDRRSSDLLPQNISRDRILAVVLHAAPKAYSPRCYARGADRHPPLPCRGHVARLPYFSSQPHLWTGRIPQSGAGLK